MPYCPQSAPHFDTGLKSQRLMSKELVLAEALESPIGQRNAFYVGAAWRAART